MSAPRKARVVVFGFAQLAAISHKLNRDDLAQMMVVGVALYQQGLKEFRAVIDEQTLFAALPKKWMRAGRKKARSVAGF
jgi:hypothetical protein